MLKDPKIAIVVKKKKVLPKIIKIFEKRSVEPTFEPSLKVLLRIVESITEHGSEGKTQLSLDAHLNYSRLAKHIVWLEKKGLVESIIKDSKINVGLTEKGRLFASAVSN